MMTAEPSAEYSSSNEIEVIVTMQDILDTFSKKTEEKKAKDIKQALILKLIGNDIGLFENRHFEIEKKVDELLRQDKKLGDESLLHYSKGKYRQRRNINKPGGRPTVLQHNDFIGRAGECAVMSELLFRGYNVNHMMVDGGVDLVAFKDQAYFFIQVKTVALNDGTIKASIPIVNYEKNSAFANQMRYFIIGRYVDKNDVERNHFFMFTHGEIEKLIHNRTVKKGEMNIVIKIKFHEKTEEPILYNEDNEEKAGYHFNRFKL